MMEFIGNSAIFALLLTLGAYELGQLCRKKCNYPLVNPLLIAIVVVAVFLQAAGIPARSFRQGSEVLATLLKPATVCLAIPLYSQLKALKKRLPAVLAGVVAGTVACLLCVSVVAWLFHMDAQLYFSLLPKGITTAMGVALAESTGGVGAVTTAAIIITGLLGSLLGNTLCRLLRIKHPVAQGVAYGTAAHVIGTARATELDALAGAASSLALVVAGTMTAAVVPVVYMFLV